MRVCIAAKIDEQTPLLQQGDSAEKAIYLGVDADGNRIFMARPGMRLVSLDDPPSDGPVFPFFHGAPSTENGNASLLEALRNAKDSPLNFDAQASTIFPDDTELTSRAQTNPAAPFESNSGNGIGKLRNAIKVLFLTDLVTYSFAYCIQISHDMPNWLDLTLVSMRGRAVLS